MESWNSSACLGYLVMTLESAGFPADEIQQLAAIMREKLDFYDTIEAANYYDNGPY